MHHFGLVAPAGLTLLSLVSILVFIVLALLVPSSIYVILKRRLGFDKSNSKQKYKNRSIFLSFIGFISYHIFMILIWIYSWPQFTSPVHTGYEVSFGLLYWLIAMIFWTATGLIAIYLWNYVRNPYIRFPGIGFFIRLYIWNIFVMILSRQIVYMNIT